MINTFTLAFEARQTQPFFTPIRTGYLSRSAGAIQSEVGQSKYKIFSGMYNADYGKILNEAGYINYKTTLRGKTYSGVYLNKHYGWVEKFADVTALNIDMNLGTVAL